MQILYSCRDITGTVGCSGLQVSSIVSKKAAENIDALVLDVKFGSGCYQETLRDAELRQVCPPQTHVSRLLLSPKPSKSLPYV